MASIARMTMIAAVHILKTVGLYGEVKDSFGPTIPEKAIWNKRAEKELQIYMALRPDSFCDWSVKNHMEELAHEDVHKNMKLWYEIAVDEQKKELREYRKKQKTQEAQTQLLQLDPIPLIIEEDLPHDQNDRQEPIKA